MVYVLTMREIKSHFSILNSVNWSIFVMQTQSVFCVNNYMFVDGFLPQQ